MVQKSSSVVMCILTAGVMTHGCSKQSLKPTTTPANVEQFLERREFAFSQIKVLPPAMEGTSYIGAAKAKYENGTPGPDIFPPNDHVRGVIDREGRWHQVTWPGTEFEVTLGDELAQNNDAGTIARLLSRHYAAGLLEAGWHPIGGGVGDNGWLKEPPARTWENEIWTDLGRGVQPPPDKGISIYNVSWTKEDIERGYFQIKIGVHVDVESKQAHVTLELQEVFGA